MKKICALSLLMLCFFIWAIRTGRVIPPDSAQRRRRKNSPLSSPPRCISDTAAQAIWRAKFVS